MIYVRVLIWMVILCLPVNAAMAEEARIKSLYSGVVKGSVKDYYPNIFRKHSLKTIHAVTDNPWAGKVYLMNNDPKKNMAAATRNFYQGAIDYMEEYAIGYCSGYLGVLGIKHGFAFVDNFEVSQIYEDGIAHYIVSANVMCFDK